MIDPRAYLRLAPYAAILVLSLSLWGTYNWGSGHKVAREAAETALVTLRDAYISASNTVETLKKEREHAIADAITKARELERQAALVNETRLRAAVAAERRDARSLRDQLASRLSCPADAPRDPAATGYEEATAFGDVLAEALRVQAEATAAAERHAGEVRALLDGWPQ
jgi:vacuolar-type H+-ATPase subunit H